MPLLRFASASCALRWLVSIVLLAPASLHAQPVEFFSPQGEVKGVRQVTARFAKPMVPFGDPREVDPFAIDCPEKGTGRWADTKNWVFDFARDVPGGRALQLHAEGRADRRRRSGDRRGATLRVLDRRAGDHAQPSLRGKPHRRKPGVHSRSRRAGQARDDPGARALRRGRRQRGDRRASRDGQRAQDDSRQSQVVRGKLPAPAAGGRGGRAHARAARSGCRRPAATTTSFCACATRPIRRS